MSSIEVEEIEIKDEPPWEQPPTFRAPYPVFKEFSVCLENIVRSLPASSEPSITPNSNENQFRTTIITNYISNTDQDEPMTDLNALYKESLLNFEKQYFYQTILHEIMETSNLKEVKELETQYMEQLRRVSKLEIFKCFKCHYETIQKHNIKLHLLLVHNSKTESRILECKNCNFISKDSIEIKEHLKVHETSEKEKENKKLEESLRIGDIDDNFSDRDNFSDTEDTFNQRESIKISQSQNRSENRLEIKSTYWEGDSELPEDISTDPSFKRKKSSKGHKMYHCPKCDYKYYQKATVVRHFTTAHKIRDALIITFDLQKGRKKIYKCRNCLLQDRERNVLLKHLPCTNEKDLFLGHTENREDSTLEFQFLCNFCEHRTNDETYFKIHQSIHEHNPNVGKKIDGVVAKKMWHCPESGCEFKIHHIRFMTNHVLKVHRGESQKTSKVNYICETCGKCYKVQCELRRHMKAEHMTVDSSEMFHCYNCSYKTKFKNILQTHMKIHMKTEKYVCKVCGLASTRRWNHLNHLKLHEKTSDVIYKCKICNYETHIKRYLALHMKAGTHRRRAPKFPVNKSVRKPTPNPITKLYIYQCQNCEYQNKDTITFQRHLKKYHPELSGPLTKKCLQCEFQTTRKKGIYVHTLECHPDLIGWNKRKIWTQIKTLKENNFEKREEENVENTIKEEVDYKCEECDFKTKEKYYLHFHLKTHLKRFQCYNCEFETYAKQNLIRHMKKHQSNIQADKDKKSKLTCPYCPFKTNLPRALMMHKIIHKGPGSKKLQKCKFCGAMFRHEKNLKQHIRTQHPEQDDSEMMKCKLCDHYHTKTPQYMQLHLRKRHRLPHLRNKYKEYCTIVDPTAVKLKSNHANPIHNRKLPYTLRCKQCDYTGNVAFYIKRHLQIAHQLLTVTSENFEEYCTKIDSETKSMITSETSSDLTVSNSSVEKNKDNEVLVSAKSHKFRCYECAFETNIEKEWIDHKKTHQYNTQPNDTNNSKYSCPHCPLTTSLTRAFQLHQKMHEKYDKGFLRGCKVCGALFKTNLNLRMHIQTQHPEEDKSEVMKCKLCDHYLTKVVQYMQIHLKRKHKLSHLNDRYREYCTMLDPTTVELTDNRKTGFNRNGKRKLPYSLKCQQCQYTNNVPRNFRNHFHQKHKLFTVTLQNFEEYCTVIDSEIKPKDDSTDFVKESSPDAENLTENKVKVVENNYDNTDVKNDDLEYTLCKMDKL